MIGATDTLASGVCGCGAGVATAVSGVDEPGRLKPLNSDELELAAGKAEPGECEKDGQRHPRVPAPRRSSVHGRHSDVPLLHKRPVENRLPTYKPCGG